MANDIDDIRIKDLPLAEEGIQSGDYLPVDGATDGTRKITMQDIAEANIDGLETEATNTKGAINELFNKASRTVSLTQAEYDALPASKLSDDIAYFITDGEPDVDNALWTKVGRATLDTQAQNCSEAINEIKQSLSQLHYGTMTKTFSNGYCEIATSDFGMLVKPTSLVMTPCNQIIVMRYDYDGSSASTVKVYVGNNYSGLLRFCYWAY